MNHTSNKKVVASDNNFFTLNNNQRNYTRRPKTGQALPTFGKVLSDGTIIEAIYDPTTNNSDLLVITPPSRKFAIMKSYLDPLQRIEYIPPTGRGITDPLTILPTHIAKKTVPIPRLFTEVCDFIRKYVYVGDNDLQIMASYVMLTFVYDQFEKIPYLRFFGAHGSGKSRALRVLRHICYHSTNLGASQTAANIYRILDQIGNSTLFLDEANFFDTSKNSDLVKILNDGYSKDGVVYRCDPNNYTPRAYQVFSPKVIANHTTYDDPALESRMLSIGMKPSKDNDVPISLPVSFKKEADYIQGLLLRYRLDFISEASEFQNYPELSAYDARTRETILPLIWSQNHHVVPNYILDFLEYQNELRHERHMFDEDAVTAFVILDLVDQGITKSLVKEIRDLVLDQSNLDIPYKRIGGYLRSFGCTAIRNNRGVLFDLSRMDKDRLLQRFG